MFNKLISEVAGPVSDVLIGFKEGFAKCDSEKEVILLKKVLQDMLNDEAKSRKDQL